MNNFSYHSAGKSLQIGRFQDRPLGTFVCLEHEVGLVRAAGVAGSGNVLGHVASAFEDGTVLLALSLLLETRLIAAAPCGREQCTGEGQRKFLEFVGAAGGVT